MERDDTWYSLEEYRQKVWGLIRLWYGVDTYGQLLDNIQNEHGDGPAAHRAHATAALRGFE